MTTWPPSDSCSNQRRASSMEGECSVTSKPFFGLSMFGAHVAVHVRAHQRLVADLEPAVHQPVFHLRIDAACRAGRRHMAWQ